MNPEIPGNTGNIGRLSVGLGARLHLIHPLGFRVDEKAARRAGIDHWRYVDRVEHADSDAFWAWADGRRVHLLSARGERPYTAIRFEPGDVLLFGRESAGLPDDLVADRGAWRIPIRGSTDQPPRVRSLNLANAVAVVGYEAYRQLLPEEFDL